jgi:uncharacterized membrane protein HdeD (DUF308 family)
VVFSGLIIVQGMFAFINGLIDLGYYPGSIWELFYGLISIIIGFALIMMPELSMIVLMYIFAIWLVVSGISQIVQGLFIRRSLIGEFTLISSGVLSILLAIGIMLFPSSTASGFMWFLAIYLTLWIVFSVVQDERLKKISVSD